VFGRGKRRRVYGEKVKLSNLGDGVGTDSGRLTGGMLVDGWTSCWVVVIFMDLWL
jgi:hypothetical protein